MNDSLVAGYSGTWLSRRLRHIPIDEPVGEFSADITCPVHNQEYSIQLQGRDALAFMWGEPHILPCGCQLWMAKDAAL